MAHVGPKVNQDSTYGRLRKGLPPAVTPLRYLTRKTGPTGKGENPKMQKEMIMVDRRRFPQNAKNDDGR